MHFSKIYIQDNFVPNIVEDQFRRKVIGIELTLNEGDDLEYAKMEAENYIKNYIIDNTVVSHNHIEERVIPESELPEIQVEKEVREQTLEEQIRSCESLKVLKAYQLLVKKDHILQEAYNQTMKSLTIK